MQADSDEDYSAPAAGAVIFTITSQFKNSPQTDNTTYYKFYTAKTMGERNTFEKPDQTSRYNSHPTL